MSKKQPSYSDEFKRNIVALTQSGRTIREISNEYGVSKSAIHSWKVQYQNSGSFKAKDNISESEQELRQLRKDNKQLRMENDVLKQAALIFAQKEK